MKVLLLTALLAYLALALLVHLLADRMMFHPPAASYDAGDRPVVLVPTEDGVRIAVLHLPEPGAELTLIHAHGNAEDIGQLGLPLEILRRAGFSVLAFDYRGYGMSSPDAPTASGAVRDMEAVLRYAQDELGIPVDRLVLHGRSIGSGPAIELATRYAVGGLIVESGFVGAYRVVTRVPLFPFDPFPNLRRIAAVRTPVLVVHGERDEVIPAWHGHRLFSRAREPRRGLWLEEAGHNDLASRAGDTYVASLREFRELVAEGGAR